MAAAIQDSMEGNGCFGCGPSNQEGLQLKSRWDGEHYVADYNAQPHMTAGPPHFLNGGIAATLIDCHAICSAAADAYRQEGREVGQGDMIWYVTGRLDVTYRKPVPIDADIHLQASIESRRDRRSTVSCRLLVDGVICAEASVEAIRVDPSWLEKR